MYDVDLDKLCNAIKIKCNNLIEKNVILNILLSKVVCIAGIKNLTFNSPLNIFGGVAYSHFGVNFLPSGGNKNNLINIVDDIFSFIDADITAINQKIKQDYIDDEMSALSVPEQRKFKKKIEKKAEEQELLLKYINDGSPAGLYNTAELIDRLKKGFICIKNTEFSSYYVQAAINKASNNQLFLDCTYDLWDGLFSSARKIKGLCRKEIKGITTSVIFMSSFVKMQNTNVMKAYRDDLLSGNARRFLFVHNYKIDYFLNPPAEPTEEEQEEATRIITEYKEYLKTKYDNINPNSQYCVEKRVTDLIKEWYKQKCMPRLQELAKKSNSENNEIIKTYIFNCRWTILKLLNSYNLLINPAEPIIKDTYLTDVIEFWEQSLKALEDILYSKNVDTLDVLTNCFIDNIGKDLKKGEICKICEIEPHDFKKVYEDNINDIIADLADKGYQLSIYKGRANTLIHRCEKIDTTLPHLINVSIAKLKNMDETPTKFEYQELTTEEFIKLIKIPTAFVPCELKEGKRAAANNIGNQNTIWLDFDDIKSMSAVLACFEQYSYIAYTTKNHQKEKNGKICDRFRLVLFTETMMPTDTDTFKRVMKYLIGYYGADSACSDLARLLWSSPRAEIIINNGKLFDWREYNIDYSENYKKEKEYYSSSKSTKTKSFIDINDDILMTSEGDDILKVWNVVEGQRNKQLFRIAIFLGHLIEDGKISRHKAVDKMKDVLSKVDLTGFNQYEQERMVAIIENAEYR